MTLLRGDFRALVVSPAKSAQIRTIEDLKGGVVGVSTIGSPNQFFAASIAHRHGIANNVSTVAVGTFTTAVASLERNRIDAAVLSGSAISVYQRRHPEARILVDARTPEGMREAFGVDQFPTGVLYSTAKWLASNKETAGRIVRATRRCLDWIHEHSPEEIAQKMPERLQTEPEADREAIRITRPSFSADRRMVTEAAEAVRTAMAGLPENTRLRNVDLSKTFTNEFLAAP